MRKPAADVVMMLAAVYGTSMDFVYHAFYRQHVIWNFPDDDLQYAMRDAQRKDIIYLRERSKPEEPPVFVLPKAFIIEKSADVWNTPEG